MQQLANQHADCEIVVASRWVTADALDLVIGALYGTPVALSVANVVAVLCVAAEFGMVALREQCMKFIAVVYCTPREHRDVKIDRMYPLVQDQRATDADLLRLVEYLDACAGDDTMAALDEALNNMLCADGYAHLLPLFTQLPLPWVERLVEADAFWCPDEYARYQFLKLVLAQRSLTDVELTHLFDNCVIYTHMTAE